MPHLLVEKIEAQHLEPGDLYSDKGPEFWQNTKLWACGLFICLKTPPKTEDDAIYRITLIDNDQPAMNPKKPPGME